MSIEITSLVVTVFLGLVGYLITYVNNVRLSQRADRLARINRQLGEFYGPLFALGQASDTAWRAFRQKYRPGGAYFKGDASPTAEDLEAWRLWITIVFMPNNSRMYELILTKSDLLIESEMPQCLLDLCAHVTAFQVVLKKWADHDFSEHVSLLEYPSEGILEYARQAFETLKAEQARLIGKKTLG